MATTTKTKKMITLYSSDGEEFKIEESVAKRGRTKSKKHVDSSSSKVITYPKRTNSKKHEDSSSSKVFIYPYRTRTIVLCSSDGEEFVVGEMEAVLCEKIKHMFGDGCDGKVVPVPDVTGEVLSKVIEYLEKHVYEKTTDEELKAWDAEFVNVDGEMLFHLITAANDLGINSLRQLACDRVVASCKENVNIKNGFTSEKKKEVRRKRKKC